MKYQSVEEFFKAAKIGRPKSEAIFEKNGRKRFREAFDELMFVIQARVEGADLDPYDLKNSSLELSLYVGEYYASNMWREFAQWIAKENLPAPNEVLDLGCENGVLTCFCAALWPNAKVTGVDASAPAIAAARELATRLGLSNITFEHSDAPEFLAGSAGRFDVIVATMFMHEFLHTKGGRKPFLWGEHPESLEHVRLTADDQSVIQSLSTTAAALNEGGLLISLDRSPTSASMWWYAQVLEKAGLKVSLSRSYVLEVQGPSRLETLPLTVARKRREGDTETTPEEILSLATFRKISEMSLHLKEMVADVFVRSLGPTEILFEATADYIDGSGTRILRLMKTPTLLVVHDFTTLGYQEAFIAPLVALPDILSNCVQVATALQEHCAVIGDLTEAGKVWLSRLDAPHFEAAI
ncbi:class I SAM-dependent methyltransferase [Microvirga guangxiensis]|uniref:Methyltransferase domain-containing protein n=1 Tax=Microvirga guangxiensis TaxID=549386 RepID=A0A1G5F4Y8_9HYPH|nr:class I SAM-dependent methyltransferase [Microvirga guangxiensis]SCY34277.1 Methyltransferase domain-containing protein [Microvirga guangxiensis]